MGVDSIIDTDNGPVSAVWNLPPDTGRREARAALVLAHGAGQRYDHPAMTALAEALAARGPAVCRFNFPYAEGRRKPPDAKPVLVRTWLAALAWAAARPEAEGLPLFAGGRSMGGRMATVAAEEHPEFRPRGLVLFAYPLHPPGKPERIRAGHLVRVPVPMLFVSGTRDPMAPRERLDPVVAGLGPRAEVHWVEGADHGFAVLKRSRRTGAEAVAEGAGAAAGWIAARLAG